MAGQLENLASEGVVSERRGDGRVVESLRNFLLHVMLKIYNEPYIIIRDIRREGRRWFID